ncbi:lysoplasmalogenase family protein [Shimia sp.]|uniref:lysoplasmalogenase family protein n=1 Tax=Shimia sp. TaxID=1954381 RepID=UPI00356AC77F
MTFLEEIALRQSLRAGLLLLGLLAALLYAAVFCYRGPSGAKTLVKAVPLLSFALAGLTTFAAPLVIVALLLSAVGDIALSRPGRRAFLTGLVGFAAAHLVYVLHFAALSGGVALSLAALPVVVFALSTERWLVPHTGDLRWPVRVYVLLISLMGITALGLEGRMLAMLGAFAFIASDTILSLQLFRMGEGARWQVPASVVLWGLYVGGQLAILAGAGWATPLFQFR